jgi:hypothetical protein
LSYYASSKTLDFTTGNPHIAPSRLGSALGRHLTADEIPRCFGCHSTASTTSNHFDPIHLMPGVGCEACHGPGSRHVAEMSLPHDPRSPTFIFNPARLDSTAAVDFCGACHRTSVDVTLSGVTGILTLRFPAYRLERSRCRGVHSSSLTCEACHDSHQPLAHNPAAYDKNCLGCHHVTAPARVALDTRSLPLMAQTKLARPSICPVGTKACVTCHMPKYNIPDMHTTFTDHKIAIHRGNGSFTE